MKTQISNAVNGDMLAYVYGRGVTQDGKTQKDPMHHVVPNAPEVLRKVARLQEREPADRIPSTMHKLLLAGNGQRRVRANYVTEPAAITPEVRASDPRYAAFLKDLADRTNEEWPTKINPDTGYSISGTAGDFNTVKSMSGVKSSHANVPPTDNNEQLREAGITDTITPEDRDIWDAFSSVALNRAEEVSFAIPKKSSLTVPFHTSNMDVKRKLLQWNLYHLESILKYAEKDDWEGLFRQFALIPVYMLGFRLQPDGWIDGAPKPRFAGKAENFKKGSTFPKDPVQSMEMVKQLTGIDGIAAMRVRTFYALSGAVGHLLSTLIHMFVDPFLEEFEYSYHHTTAYEQARKLERVGAVSMVKVDVTQMDQNVPAAWMEMYNDMWRERTSEPVAKLFERVNYAPYIAPSTGVGQPSFMSGNPFNPEDTTFVGLASGRPDVSIVGKLWMTWNWLVLLHHAHKHRGYDFWNPEGAEYADKQTAIRAFLKGEHPYAAMLNMGDDTIFILKETSVLTREELRESLTEKWRKSVGMSTYAKYDEEESLSFLGLLGVGDEKFHSWMPSPHTALTGFYCNERGVDSPMRSNWDIGVLARNEHYGQSQTAADVWRFSEELWRKHMPDTLPPTAAARKSLRSRDRSVDIQGLTQIDREVLADESKLYYKYKVDELSPEVLEMLAVRIPSDRIAASWRPHINPKYL